MTAHRPFLLGLTGSIGMGKSTTAEMFARRGVPVWDADAVVHRLYSAGGLAVGKVAEICPEALVDGAIDRAVLRGWIKQDPDRLARLEAVVHPLVARDRAAFIGATSAPVIVFDIPLLFETGAETWLDGVVVVSTDADTQRQRVLSRPEMTEDQFELIVAKQMSDAQKRAKATYVVPTDTMEQAEKAVAQILSELEKDHA